MNRFVLLLTCLSIAVPAAAQIPDEFTNLKLLDPAIEKGRLVGIMKTWTSGLGVRCNHCHVGPDNLQGMDFASDEKATKRTARRMLEMSRAINGELLADLPVVAESDRDSAQVVSCYSCHRGMSRPPRQIGVELGIAARENGARAAVARYHELVEKHENRGRYDLRPDVLLDLANGLLAGQDAPGARELVDEVLAMQPQSAAGFVVLARIELASGRLDEAQSALDKAMAIAPDDPFAGWVTQQVAKARAARESAADPSQDQD